MLSSASSFSGSAALVVFVLALWLLSEILLPFIAGLAIAYLLTPLTDRLERLGVNRLAGGAVDHNARGACADLSHSPGGADSRRPTVVLYRERSRQCDEVAGAIERSQPALDSKVVGRWLQRRQIDRRFGDTRCRLADRISAFVVVGRTRAGIRILTCRRHAGCCVLS